MNYQLTTKKPLATPLTARELKELRVKLIVKQNWKCKICGDFLDLEHNPKNVHLDHDHKTGLVRAVLCRRCNTIEGKMTNWYKRLTKRELKSSDDQERLYKGLTKYLRVKSTKYVHPSHGKKRKRSKAKSPRRKKC